MAGDYSKAVKPQASHELDDDPDAGKGAVEGDRPDDVQQSNRNGTGLDRNGLPNDQVAIAEDVIGAQEDKSQG